MEKIKTVAYLRYGCSDAESTSELVRRDTGFYRAFCEEKGMELVDVYFDHASGNCQERLGFKKLMDDTQTGKFERIIVKHIGKLARDSMEVINILRQLKERGISLWCEMEGGLIDAEKVAIFARIAETESKNKTRHPFVSLWQNEKEENELDEMLVYLDKLNHRMHEEEEGVYDTEVEIRIGEKTVKTNLNEEIYGILYDIFLSMREEI